MDKKAVRRWGLVVGGIGLVLVLFCAFAAWESRDTWFPQYLALRDQVMEWLRHVNPVLFFTLMAVVPVAPVPMSIFYLSAGIFPLPVALLGITIAIPANLAITYWLTRTILHPLATKLLARADMKIPRLSCRRNELLFAVIIRCCGTPYTLQNYIIPLAGIKFRDFMLIGIPFQYVPAVAMVFFGNSLLKGEFKKALVAIVALVVLGTLTKLIHSRLAGKKAGKNGETEISGNASDAR